MTALPWSSFIKLDADAGIFANIRKKMPVVCPGVQIKEISSFVDIGQRHNIGPPRSVAGSDMSDELLTQILPRFSIGHLTVGPNHAAAMLNRLLFLL